VSTTKTTNRRKSVAVGLAILGVAGLSLASASTLALNGEDNASLVQAGVDDLSASLCQTTDIDVTFTLAGSTPGSLGTGASFGYPGTADAIVLDEIDADCAGKTIKVALGTDAGALVGTEYSSTAAAGPLTLHLNGSTPNFGSALDNTGISSIGQISVTIYD
jgi:hypothetical protein